MKNCFSATFLVNFNPFFLKMFTVNANKYHVNTILIIFQAYLFTVSLIILRNIKKNSILEIKNKMATIRLEKM
jgi:hypothetical protein